MSSMFEEPSTFDKAKEEASKLAAAAQGLFSDAVNKVSATVRGATDMQSAGRKLKRKCTRRRGKKGGCFSLKWLKSKFSGSRKRKTGRKSRKR